MAFPHDARKCRNATFLDEKCKPSLVPFFLFFSFQCLCSCLAQSSICRTACGDLPINYPFGIDDGCGSPSYRNILVCPDGENLQFRTPSGRYLVKNISYSDPHLVISNPFMWNCDDGEIFPHTRAFSLDTSTPFSLSKLNNYLFFNCSDSVIAQPEPSFCQKYPDQCDSSCDTASYLCRNKPSCPSLLSESSCCSYFPKASASLRLMLEHCVSYTSIYWKFVAASPPYDQVPDYGIRVDFEIPVTTRCLWCQDTARGGGTCGFDTGSQSFLCLCDERNATTYCRDSKFYQHSTRVGVISGSVCVGVGLVGVTGLIWWYVKKVRPKRVVTCGVQDNANRLF